MTDTTITIGQTNDLAGTGGTPYGVITPAFQAYLDKVNTEDGGVCGRQLKLVAEDDQYSGPVTVDKTKKLVEQDKVAAIIGALGTATHLAVVDYLNDPNGDGDQSDGVPDLFVATGYSGWGDVAKYPWTTGFIPDYISDAKVQGQYLKDTYPNAKVGIMYQNDAFGQNYVDGLTSVLGDMIVSKQSYEASATDVSSQILTIQNDGADTCSWLHAELLGEGYRGAHTSGYMPQFFQSYVNAPTQEASLIGGGTDADQMSAGFEQLDGAIGTNYVMDAVKDIKRPRRWSSTSGSWRRTVALP